LDKTERKMPLRRSWRRWKGNITIKFKEGKWEVSIWIRMVHRLRVNFSRSRFL